MAVEDVESQLARDVRRNGGAMSVGHFLPHHDSGGGGDGECTERYEEARSTMEIEGDEDDFIPFCLKALLTAVRDSRLRRNAR
jgi:hypothetical protein